MPNFGSIRNWAPKTLDLPLTMAHTPYMTNNTAATTTRMTATALAQDFYRRGANRWLSLAQTKFLASLARQPRSGAHYDGQTHTYTGSWITDGDNYTWTMYISPRNGCGLFNVKVYSKEMYAADREYDDAQRALGARVEETSRLIMAGDQDAARAYMMQPEHAEVVQRSALAGAWVEALKIKSTGAR